VPNLLPDVLIEGEERSIPFVLSTPGVVWPSSVVFKMRDGNSLVGNSMDDFSAAELRELNETNQIDYVEFDLIPFRAEYPNGNFIRFRERDETSFFKSFAAKPYLRDHRQWMIAAREGTIRTSRRVTDDNVSAMEQKIRVTNKEGITSFINGQMDRFSIGWDATGITCSVCGQNWFTCTHWPGREYQINEGQDSQVCELIFEEPTGVETSAVNRPAVDGTRILSVLSQMKNENLKQMEVETMARQKKAPVETTETQEVVIEKEVEEVASAPEVLTVGEMTVEQLVEALGLTQISEAIVSIDEELSEIREQLETLPDNDVVEAVLERVSQTEQAIVSLAGEASVTRKVSPTPEQHPHLQSLQNILKRRDKTSMVPEPEAEQVPHPTQKAAAAPATKQGTEKALKIADPTDHNRSVAAAQMAMWGGNN